MCPNIRCDEKSWIFFPAIFFLQANHIVHPPVKGHLTVCIDDYILNFYFGTDLPMLMDFSACNLPPPSIEWTVLLLIP
jgi:hypothetical protein